MRLTSALNRAAASLSTVRGCFLLDLSFSSGHARFNDSAHELSFSGSTYYGLGGFGTFDGITEDVDAVAYGVRFELSGVDSSLVSTLMTERYQGRAASLYLGLFTENYAFVDTPELQWSGYMDTMDVVVGAEASKIILTCEHRIRQSPPNSRWSDAEQKSLYPGDRFFEFAPFVSGYTSNWGGKSTSWSYKPGGGGYSPT